MPLPQTFNAMVVTETADKKFVREIKEKKLSDLPAGELLIEVKYSSLNYKDALSATGNKGVTRNYPHTPGIDAAGVVAESALPGFVPGDHVIVTGFDLGMNTSGGFGQYIRVPASWVLNLPEHLSLKESMAYGTAGFTAALAVLRMQQHGLIKSHGEVLVTGATGGVGSVAVSLLAKLGFHVVAATGKTDERDFLLGLGAKEIISRHLGKGASEGALGGRRGDGRGQHARDRDQIYQAPRRHRSLRERGVGRSRAHRLSLYPPRRQPLRHRFCGMPDGDQVAHLEEDCGRVEAGSS